jgi:hypothetical protein
MIKHLVMGLNFLPMPQSRPLNKRQNEMFLMLLKPDAVDDRMKFFRIFCFLSGLLLLAIPVSFGQLSAGGVPPSITFNLEDDRNVSELLRPDLQDIHREDNDFPTPYRYGIILPADFTPETSGTWMTLEDGSLLWRLTIRVDGALALSPCFDRFHLPAGGKLFLYDKNKTQVIGAFTDRNNSKKEYFATELIKGDQMTLEYYQPEDSRGELKLHLNEIVYAYRGVGFLGNMQGQIRSSGDCEVNVNCPEGQEWQLQKRGVVRINIRKDSSTFWCSGSLLNNVRRDHTPYILTADHCGISATSQELLQWVFYFDYESPDCQNPSVPPVSKSLVGAIRVAESGNSASSGSDFYLAVLTEPIPANYYVYFNGWNHLNIPSPNGVTIHHPQGDIKKISTYTTMLESSRYGSNPDSAFWKVFWDETTNGHGVTERGSSGSPLFDSSGRIVGTLTGGESNCDSPSLIKPDYYGKFYWSWDLNGSDSTHRLRDWLDPDSTGVNVLDGLLVSLAEKEKKQDIRIFPNPFNEFVNIEIPGIRNSSVNVDVFDIMGNLIKSDNLMFRDSSVASANFPDLSPGIYLLKVFSGEDIFCVKMIKL